MELKDSLSSAASSPQSDDVAMDDAGQSSGVSGDEGTSRSHELDSPLSGADTESGDGASRTTKATSNLAKFKAAQDLRIQTANLPPKASGKTKPRAQSVGSATAMGLGGREEDAEDEGGGEGEETPVPVPCSTGKKRRRRTAAQIDRKFPCTYPGCTKAYGSEGSLTQHQRLKHRNQSPEPGVQAAQLTNFFLPLHRTPRSLPTGPIGRTSGPGGARTVTIRPAGIDGLTLHDFNVAAAAASLVPEHEAVTNDFLLPSAAHAHALNHTRQHLRARSNSMPISFSTPSALGLHYATVGLPHSASAPLAAALPSSSPLVATGDATPSSAKAKATRRSRPAGTPRSTGKPPLRRNKCRSKSESLQDVMEPFVFQDEMCRPIMDRSTSDNSVESYPLGPASAPGFDGPRFDWRYAVAHSQHSDSPVSSVEEAIDSDILSVLADYDTSDTGDSTLELVGSGSFEDPTESSHASSSGGRFPEPEDEWISHQDAQYLTTTLEKMSMIHDSPPGSTSILAHAMGTEEDDPMTTIKLEFPGPLEAFAVAEDEAPPVVAGEDMIDGLKFHGSRVNVNDPSAVLLGRDLFEAPASSGFKQEPVHATAAQASWTKELAALEPYASSGIDQVDYMDVDASSYGPLQWKATGERLRPATSQALSAGSFDSLTAYLQHGDKHNAAYATLGESFALDAVDYAMDEPRLSSPVVCQMKDL